MLNARNSSRCDAKQGVIMRLRLFSFSTLIFSLGSIAIGLAAQVPKASYDEKAVANFYRGKSIRIIVGFTAGGGYDQYSRLIGRHISKFIPSVDCFVLLLTGSRVGGVPSDVDY